MGASESSSVVIDESVKGFHVLNVEDNSPGHAGGLEPYFDFVVAANGVRLEEGEGGVLTNILKNHLQNEVPLHVFSLRSRELRICIVVPQENWGGSGLLGICIRHCSFGELDETVWHVMDVMSGSPAAQAGLISDLDYIVASADTALHSSDDIFEHIAANNLNTIKLYVYNCDMDRTRMVMLTPNLNWGGPGYIGCALCYGLLHRIPTKTASKSEREQNPIKKVNDAMTFSSAFDSNNQQQIRENNHSSEESSITTEPEKAYTAQIPIPNLDRYSFQNLPQPLSLNQFSKQPQASSQLQHSFATPTQSLLNHSFPNDHQHIGELAQLSDEVRESFTEPIVQHTNETQRLISEHIQHLNEAQHSISADKESQHLLSGHVQHINEAQHSISDHIQHTNETQYHLSSQIQLANETLHPSLASPFQHPAVHPSAHLQIFNPQTFYDPSNQN